MVDAGLRDLGLKPPCAWKPRNPSGIVALQHERSAEIHAALEGENVQVMHGAGRIRIAVHGYNTREDIERVLGLLAPLSRRAVSA